jgi:hypothetical protein
VRARAAVLSLALLAACGRAAPATSRALAVTTGRDQTCALLDDHRVKCWGSNMNGELGLGDTRTRGAGPGEMGDALPAVDLGAGRTATAISAGRYHTCALLDDGAVKCWGMRAFSGVELDPSNANIGDEPGEMGDALSPLDLGPGRKAKLLAAGYLLSCAILDDGSARCWGEQPKSDLTTPLLVLLSSQRPVVALAPGHYGVLALFDDGTAQDLAEGAEQPAIVPAGAFASALGGSAQARCAVLKDGAVHCGEGHPLTTAFASLHDAGTRFVAVGVGEIDGACGVAADGGVHCFEQAQDCTPDWCGAAATPGWAGVRLGQRAAAITTAGSGTSCARLASGAVRCWGQQLGLPPNPALGASFDLTVGDGLVTRVGPFHDVDLGSRGP